MQTYFCIDFETINYYDWLAYAAIVVNEHGQILHRAEGYTHRSAEFYLPNFRNFWYRHHEAHQYLIDRALATPMPIDLLEQQLALFARHMHELYPHLIMVSDNPTFDMGLLNQILLRHGLPPIHIRANGLSYAQVTCTWSEKRAMCKALGHLTVNRWLQIPQTLTTPLEIESAQGLKHTPAHDVRRTVCEYLRFRKGLNCYRMRFSQPPAGDIVEDDKKHGQRYERPSSPTHHTRILKRCHTLVRGTETSQSTSTTREEGHREPSEACRAHHHRLHGTTERQGTTDGTSTLDRTQDGNKATTT